MERDVSPHCFLEACFFLQSFVVLLCFFLRGAKSQWEILAAAVQQMTINSRCRRHEDPIWSRTRPPMSRKSPETEPPRRVHHVPGPKGRYTDQRGLTNIRTDSNLSALLSPSKITFDFFSSCCSKQQFVRSWVSFPGHRQNCQFGGVAWRDWRSEIKKEKNSSFRAQNRLNI